MFGRGTGDGIRKEGRCQWWLAFGEGGLCGWNRAVQYAAKTMVLVLSVEQMKIW